MKTSIVPTMFCNFPRSRWPGGPASVRRGVYLGVVAVAKHRWYDARLHDRSSRTSAFVLLRLATPAAWASGRVRMTPRSRSLGMIALVATAALWGSNHVVARAVREIVPLPALVFWRWALAALALTVIAWPALRQAWPEIRPRLAELAFGGAI